MRENVHPASATAAAAVDRFVDALAFNWIIGGTNAHAKNYSVLLSGSQVRLAPLYDIASALAYDDMHEPRLRMAMKVGGEYGIEATSGRHWRRFAQANQLDPDATVARIDDLAARTPDAFATVAKDSAGQGRLSAKIRTTAAGTPSHRGARGARARRRPGNCSGDFDGRHQNISFPEHCLFSDVRSRR